MMNKEELYDKAMQKWGVTGQIMMTVEEMSELTQSLSHYLRKNKQISIRDIASEIADVKIMIEQMEQYFDIDYMIEEIKQEKLKKLNSYINQKELVEK